MKIIHIVTDLAVGGVQKFCLNLAVTQAHSNDVEVWVIGSQVELPIPNESIKLKVLDLATDWHRIKTHVKIFFALRKMAGQVVVHTHGIALFFCFLSALQLRGLRFVHTVHNLCGNEAGRSRRALNRILFKWAGVRPVAISQEVAKSFQYYYPYIQYNLIQNGVPPISRRSGNPRAILRKNGITIKDSDRVFINIGRFDYQKNRAILLGAFREILLFDANSVLLLVGGDLDDTNPIYRSIVQDDLVKNGNVILTGDIVDVGDFYMASDFFISSSLFEGLPLALLEAMSLGLPCVGTPAGGAAGILRKIGIASEDFTSTSLAEAAIAMMKSVERFDKNRIQKFYQDHYSVERCAQEYQLVYSEGSTSRL